MQLIEQDVSANGVRLHVYRTGTDKPPLVFAHGITDNGLCFLPIAEQLAEDFEIVLYDARGHGRSDPSPPRDDPSRAGTRSGRARRGARAAQAGIARSLAWARPRWPCLPACSPRCPAASSWKTRSPSRPWRPSATKTTGMRARWREWAAADKQRSVDELVQISRQRDPTWPEAERLPWAQAKQQLSLTVFEEGVHGRCRIGRTDRVPDRLPDSAHHGRSSSWARCFPPRRPRTWSPACPGPGMSASPVPGTTSVAISRVCT